MNERQMAEWEALFPARAVAALNEAHRQAVAAKTARVVVIEDGLYRVNAEGKCELVRLLPPRTRRPDPAKGEKA